MLTINGILYNNNNETYKKRKFISMSDNNLNSLDGDADPIYTKTITFVSAEYATVLAALEFYIEGVKTCIHSGGLTDLEAYHSNMELASIEKLYNRLNK